MKAVLRAIHIGAQALWSTGILQAAAGQLLHWLWLLLKWLLAHPVSIPTGLFSLYLARMFDTPMTRALMDFAGIPMFFYYTLIIGIGISAGAGITLKQR